nr:hypothetical protein [Tanacetum cinerariifolium]
MARLAFCDYHNMVAILEKYEHNVDFHQIVDFVEASHIRYALTINPTVYVSHIRQFWSTASIETTDEGTKILATVDGRIVPLFDTMLVHQGEGSGTPTEPHHTPSPEAQHSSPTAPSSPSLLPATTETIPTVIPTDIPSLRDDGQGEACPIVSGLEADQDRANIVKTSTLPHDSTPRVTSFAADEGNLEITSMKARIKMLEDKDAEGVKPSGEDATIKERSLEIREEADVEKSTERGSNDNEELVNVLTSLDAASILTSRFQMISVPPATEVATEQIAREDQRMNNQIARDAEIARIHAEKELQMLIDGLDINNETFAKYIQEFEQFAADLSIGEMIELVNDLIEDFIPMGSKEEGERFKRKGLRLEQESPKKMKTSEEVSEEDLKEMMQLVPVEEVYVEALQVKHLIIDWEIYSEGQRTYWKIIRLGGSTTVYQFFVDMLKHFDREDLTQLWTLVRETLSIRQATSDKEKELWVELKRLYEPDVEDQLWTHTQALMHDPVEWRLYDTCGVHHMFSRD